MISGLPPFTQFHVILSLVGILSGLVVVFGLLAARRINGWTAIFLVTTVLTSVTGFLFPYQRFLPSHALGIISLVLLAIAMYARYGRKLMGIWSRTYAATAVLALYLNVFVLIVQLFEKVPSLKAMAPTQSEPPFKLTELLFLTLFMVITVSATVRFRADRLGTA